MHKNVLAMAIAFALTCARVAQADVAPAVAPDSAADARDPSSTTLGSVEVNAALDRSRNQLSPEIGASQYTLDEEAIEQLPLGDQTPLNQVLLRAPGVVQDSFGQLHIRGDHEDIQYRINGITIPESISGFGQALDTDMIERITLLTGALPAQYGYRTAGVVDITTKTGAHEGGDRKEKDEDDEHIGGSVSVLGGSFGTFNPEVSVHGNTDRWSWFATAEYQQSDIGIENPTPARNAIHDHTNQLRGFGYLSYLLDDTTRVGFMFGTANNRFQIPNNPGQQPTYTLAGVDAFDSRNLDERQREVTRFGVLSLQGKFGSTDYQIALGQRYTSVNYHPDLIGDLIFNGVAGRIGRSNRADTLQGDFSLPLNDVHTLRYGVYVSNEHPVSNDTSLVFPADAQGNQTRSVPITIVDNAPPISARTYGAYVQDQWNITDKITLNYGVRADKVDAYVSEGQISPRIGMVYQWSDTTTLHAGYARYFTPPPAELISPTDIAKFQGTTNQLRSDVNAQTLSERSHYLDAGVSQKLGDHLTLGLDAYYRKVHNLLDEGQFGAALIFSPFNYDQGRARGVEFTANYTDGGFSAFLNLAQSRAMGRDIVTGQYNFSADELDYIARHWVHLDHDQRLAGSGGVSYNWNGTKLAADFLYGSGLRRDFANTAHLPAYYQLNLSANRDFDLPALGETNLRLALINLTDKVYEIRDGSGIGVGAPQFGPRRGLYFGITKKF